MNTRKLFLTLGALVLCGTAIAAITTAPSRALYTSNTNQRPVGVSTHWAALTTAGAPATQDAATVTNPDSNISTATHYYFTPSDYQQSRVAFRLGYDVTLTAITPMVGKVFGRTVSSDGTTSPWMLLSNLNGDVTMTFTPNTTTDERDSSLAYTRVDPILHVVDRMGCNQIVFGVQTAFAGSTGSTSTSVLYAKEIPD